ncbi:hypothetical protein KSP40_PGU006161 [Platanthera guangdongensis]|uniref:holo-[acyl-carrier-protein] synthase n=1 Tax=Platanthera guangdongensis TaxID=2320717 RepID=A0ABR2LR12_9ASPA
MLPFSNEFFTRKLFTVPSLPLHRLPCPRFYDGLSYKREEGEITPQEWRVYTRWECMTCNCRVPKRNFSQLWETHFWYIVPDEVNSTSLLNHYLNIISPCERRAVLRINGDKQQKCGLLARALVRTTLSRYMQCKIMPQSLSFSKNKYGKPQLIWQQEGWIPPCLHFNISHTSSLVACGVTVDLQVGIDIEDKQRTLKHDILSFARRFFSPKEIEFLCGLTDPVIQHQECIKLWTLKEAYVKALGRGFSAAPFRNFTLSHEEPRFAVEVHSDSENLTENWEFATVDLSTHYGAICVEKACDMEGNGNDSLVVKVWKTIPFIEDERIF